MSDEPIPVSLIVKTGGSAEIFLADSQLTLVASGVERLETRQPPGVYKLKVRQGRTTSEHLLLLEHDTELDIPAPQIASPVPLVGTRKSHEFHTSAAIECSQQVHWHIGAAGIPGTTIFVQSRYWTGATPDASSGRWFAPPATGLSMRRFDGTERVDLESIARPGDGPAWDPSAACTVAVDPGSYILSAKTASGAIVEQTIHASPGWQTQVFILRQPLQAERRTRSPETAASPSSEDLFSLAVAMSRGSYHPSGQTHLSELARIALADERPLLSDELKSVLGGKFENPMLGVFGAHLLLLAQAESQRPAPRRSGEVATRRHLQAVPTFDQSLFDHVVRVLREFLGNAHPDVEALSLHLSQPQERTASPIAAAPMLRRSWSLLLEASEEKPFLVPVELWKRVARLTAARPFLAWFADETGTSLDADTTRELRSRLQPQTAATAEASVARSGAGVATRAAFPMSAGSDVGDTRRLARDLDVPASAVQWLMGSKGDEP